MPGLPSFPSTDEVTITRPDSRGIMCWSARRIPQNTWFRFQSISSAHSSSDIWNTGAVCRTPPELRQQMSSWPYRSIVKSMRPSTASCLEASPP